MEWSTNLSMQDYMSYRKYNIIGKYVSPHPSQIVFEWFYACYCTTPAYCSPFLSTFELCYEETMVCLFMSK